MDIPAYIEQQKINQLEFAKLVGVHQSQVSLWLNGLRVPKSRILQIEAATNGAVTRADLRPDLYAKPRANGRKGRSNGKR